MAPKTGTKRSSGARAAGKSAKQIKIDPMADKCKTVVDALRELAQVPGTVVKMLCVAAPDALTVNAKDRHTSQAAIVGMIVEAMNDISDRLEANVAEKQAPVNSANEVKTALDAKVTEKEAEHESLKDALAKAKEAIADATAAFDEAALALTQAQVDQELGDASIKKAAGKKDELEAAVRDVYNPLKEEAASKDAVTALLKLGKTYNFEETLLSAAPTAFHKGPTERGPFEQMVFTQFESAFTANIDALNKELEEGDAGKQARAGAVAVAEAAKNDKLSSLAVSKSALADSVTAEQAGSEAVLVAKQEVNEFVPGLKEKTDALDAMKIALAKFRDGAFSGVHELKELALAVEAEPEAESAGAEQRE